MAHRGLTKEKIVSTSIQLLEENGYEDFSMRELAAMLGVQASSLYNHVKNIEELYAEIAKCTVRRFQEKRSPEEADKEPDELIRNFINKVRMFVRENKELCRIVMVADCGIIPELEDQFRQILALFPFREDELIYWEEVFFGLLHGLIARENFSLYPKSKEIIDKSYSTAVQCYLDGLHTALGDRETRNLE